VLVEMRASKICGSDLRAIYREHLGEGAEAYQDDLAGGLVPRDDVLTASRSTTSPVAACATTAGPAT
jgi:hypothetical protein